MGIGDKHPLCFILMESILAAQMCIKKFLTRWEMSARMKLIGWSSLKVHIEGLVLRIVTSSACLKIEDLLHCSAWVKSNFFPSGSSFFDRNDFKPASLLTHSHSTVTKHVWIFFSIFWKICKNTSNVYTNYGPAQNYLQHGMGWIQSTGYVK